VEGQGGGNSKFPCDGRTGGGTEVGRSITLSEERLLEGVDIGGPKDWEEEF